MPRPPEPHYSRVSVTHISSLPSAFSPLIIGHCNNFEVMPVSTSSSVTVFRGFPSDSSRRKIEKLLLYSDFSTQIHVFVLLELQPSRIIH